METPESVQESPAIEKDMENGEVEKMAAPTVSPSISGPSISGRRARFGHFMRSALYRLMVASVIFAFGVLLVLITLYWPAQQALETTNSELETTKQLLLEQEMAYAALQAEKNQLERDLSESQLYAALLRVETEVMDASLGVVEGNFSRTSLAIDQAKTTLMSIASLLPERYSPVTEDLQVKLTQVGEKARSDLKNALPDLRTLSGDLAKLKENLQMP